MTYHQAVKQLAMILFGERSDPISDRKTSIQQSNVIRLPPNLNIKNVSEIDILFETRAVCDALSEVCHEPNLLLERTFIIDSFLTTPIIQNAKFVKIWREEAVFDPNREEEALAILRHVTNLAAHVEMFSNDFPLQDHLTLVRHWKESGKQIGTLLFMMFRNKRLCMDRFMDVVKQFEAARFIEGNVAVVPLSVDSEIELSWSHGQGQLYNHRENLWKLQMKVLNFQITLIYTFSLSKYFSLTLKKTFSKDALLFVFPRYFMDLDCIDMYRKNYNVQSTISQLSLEIPNSF